MQLKLPESLCDHSCSNIRIAKYHTLTLFTSNCKMSTKTVALNRPQTTDHKGQAHRPRSRLPHRPRRYNPLQIIYIYPHRSPTFYTPMAIITQSPKDTGHASDTERNADPTAIDRDIWRVIVERQGLLYWEEAQHRRVWRGPK
jgi:hypothetical protein